MNVNPKTFHVPVSVSSEKSLSSHFRELQRNSWNSFVSAVAPEEEWGELRNPGELGEREDLEEPGVIGELCGEAELNVVTNLPAVPQLGEEPVIMILGSSCMGERATVTMGEREVDFPPSVSASCSASRIRALT